jgi:hypothetical protein
MVTTDLGLLTCKKVEDVRHGRMIVCIGACGAKMMDRFTSISAYGTEKPVQLIACFDRVNDAVNYFATPDGNEWVLAYLDSKDSQGLRRLETFWHLNLPLN